MGGSYQYNPSKLNKRDEDLRKLRFKRKLSHPPSQPLAHSSSFELPRSHLPSYHPHHPPTHPLTSARELNRRDQDFGELRFKRKLSHLPPQTSEESFFVQGAQGIEVLCCEWVGGWVGG